MLRMSPVDSAVVDSNLLAHNVNVELRNVVDDGFDGSLELPHTLAITREKSDRQRTDSLRNLRLQNLKSLLAFRGHQNFLAGRKIVADDICDRVRFAGTRRTLNSNARGPLKLLDDGDLLVVVG